MITPVSESSWPSVADCQIFPLPKIQDPRGNLTFMQRGEPLPFDIQRVFYLYDVPAGELRAGHALKSCHQMLVAIAGSFDVVLRDGTNERRVRLDAAAEGLHIPPMIWREVEGFSEAAICLVLASELYSEDAYVREETGYLQLREKEKDQQPPVVRSLDFDAAYRECQPELDAAYHRFMRSGHLVLGDEVRRFEEEYATYCDATHCVGVGHGLDALLLALRALEVGPGDEVIVPANTYIATWLAVSQLGALPVAVEPDVATLNLDATRIKAAITSRTKAVLAVNLYGLPCDYDEIAAICARHNLGFVVDNAQGHGARYHGRRVGGVADLECHSFYPTKNLGAFGEAGAVTTQNADLADRIRVLRNYGSRRRYENEVRGYNSRLDELQAAFLRVKLRKLDEWNRRRQTIAAFYLESLQSVPELQLPATPHKLEPVWHQFIIRHPERDAMQKHLSSQGVETLVHYPTPPHRSAAYQDPGYGSFPLTEQLANEVLSLPIGPQLTPAATGRVVEAILSFQADLAVKQHAAFNS
ncbi:MAG TPA: aminotransferase class I/II-fold pyridoxal phosphate-dependent enzyme [Chthoniobacterales bacterium]